MTTAGDIMHRGAQWIPAHQTLDRAAQMMRELNVGALPISDENERLRKYIQEMEDDSGPT